MWVCKARPLFPPLLSSSGRASYRVKFNIYYHYSSAWRWIGYRQRRPNRQVAIKECIRLEPKGEAQENRTSPWDAREWQSWRKYGFREVRGKRHCTKQDQMVNAGRRPPYVPLGTKRTNSVNIVTLQYFHNILLTLQVASLFVPGRHSSLIFATALIQTQEHLRNAKLSCKTC